MCNPMHDIAVHGVAQVDGHSVTTDFYEKVRHHCEHNVDGNQADQSHFDGDEQNYQERRTNRAGEHNELAKVTLGWGLLE